MRILPVIEAPQGTRFVRCLRFDVEETRLYGPIAAHALEDTLSLVPFLFVTYLVLEALEHAAGNRVNAAVRRAGAAGPVVGAALGVLPQCGFSAMAATLYAGRVVTLGTLVAVFLSTSDEMLPMLLAERVDASSVATLLAVKAAIALISGVVVDAALRALRRNARVHAAIRRTVLGPKSFAGEDGSRAADIIDSLSTARSCASTSCASATTAAARSLTPITMARTRITCMVRTTGMGTMAIMGMATMAITTITPTKMAYSVVAPMVFPPRALAATVMTMGTAMDMTTITRMAPVRSSPLS